MQACLNKLPYFIVRRIGAFAVLEYHDSDTDAFAPIQYIIRSESVRFPQDLTNAAFGAAGSIGNRTNLGVLSNEHVHEATHASQFQPQGIKPYRATARLGPTSAMGQKPGPTTRHNGVDNQVRAIVCGRYSPARECQQGRGIQRAASSALAAPRRRPAKLMSRPR